MNTPVTPIPDDNTPPVGTGVRLIAVVLILVGALNMMLSWRGSLDFGSFPVVIFASGIVLYAVGSIMRHRAEAQANVNDMNNNGETV